MKRGTVGTRVLERSIIKHVKKEGTTGVSIGSDYSIVDKCPQREGENHIQVVSQGFSDENYKISDGIIILNNSCSEVNVGELALIRALNNLSTCGAVPSEMLINIQTGGDCSEQSLRDEMNRLSQQAKERNLRIIGGNTVYSGEGEGYSVTVTLFGYADPTDPKSVSIVGKESKPQAGDKVIIIGEAGHFGASLLAAENMEKIRERLSDSYISGAMISPQQLEIKDSADALLEGGAYYLHDVTFGGIYRTLLEISEYTGMGIDIIHEMIPIRQDTIEICELLGKNPYEISGTGSVVGVCHAADEETVRSELERRGIRYSVAGELTLEKKREVRSLKGKMSRSLTYYEA